MEYRTGIWCLDVLLPAPTSVTATLKSVNSAPATASVVVKWEPSTALTGLIDHLTAYEISICVTTTTTAAGPAPPPAGISAACSIWSPLVLVPWDYTHYEIVSGDALGWHFDLPGKEYYFRVSAVAACQVGILLVFHH